MRIAFISHEFPPDNGKGGIGTYIKQVAHAMAARGCDVHVFAGSPHRTCTEQTENYQVHWLQCSDGNDYRNKVVAVFAAEHGIKVFDLVESPEINGNAWEIKKKFTTVPLVIRLHAPGYLVESIKKTYIPFFAKLRFLLGALKRFKWDMGYWRSYNRETDTDYSFTLLANGITAPSDAMKAWAVKNWRINPGNIRVIPNLFTPSAALLKINISEGAIYKRIVFFGRLNVLKGLVNASKAVKKILKEYPEWKFKVIGDDGNGPYNGITMRDWMNKKLAPVIDRVEFFDGVDYEAVPAAIEQSEIVLLPSLFESFSYTCIEAMAAGKAIVGSKSGGMADLLQDKKTGLLVDPENYHEIYRALKRLITDNDLRYNVSVEARKRVLTEFNASATSEKFIGYYRQMIDTKH